MSLQAVIFSLGNEEYGIPIEDVQEITSISMTEIHPIPQAPEYIKGLITIRGEAIPLIDMHWRFGIKSEGNNSFAIIVGINDTLVGLAVDEVKEVRFLDNVSPPPALIATPFIGGIVNLPDRIIIQIIPKLLMGENEINDLNSLLS
ncbi:MAG: chemotaxis protein CheW [Gracilibacter sp. BRH_c7a]|nr:MAG: chemotaxis protein CheW [Gracilibacter sp. BRH_c7a]